MGDFNLDLLKYNSHSETDNFLNTTLPNCFQLAIVIQPTRIRDHSATLIDNIFLNSLSEYYVYDLTDRLSNFLIIQILPR